jgi:hypothetical protein
MNDPRGPAAALLGCFGDAQQSLYLFQGLGFDFDLPDFQAQLAPIAGVKPSAPGQTRWRQESRKTRDDRSDREMCHTQY